MKKEIPLMIGSPKDKALFNPKDFLKHMKLEKNKANVGVIFFSKKFGKVLKKKYNTVGKYRDGENLSFDIKKIKGKKVVFAKSEIGGPSSGTLLEEIIGLGVKKVIFIGCAGTLLDLPIGSIMIPTKAIRDEGTSYHYINPSKYSHPSKRQFDKIKKICKANMIPHKAGITWTTDAPYRETFKKINKYKKESTISVEMEAASLFAIAKYRKIEIVGIFWVSDQLLNEWNPQFTSENFLDGAELCKTILDEWLTQC
jgi:uridine phosphorylase